MCICVYVLFIYTYVYVFNVYLCLYAYYCHYYHMMVIQIVYVCIYRCVYEYHEYSYIYFYSPNRFICRGSHGVAKGPWLRHRSVDGSRGAIILVKMCLESSDVQNPRVKVQNKKNVCKKGCKNQYKIALPSLSGLLESWLPWLPPGCLLRDSREPSGSLLGFPGCLLGASWEPPECLLGASGRHREIER